MFKTFEFPIAAEKSLSISMKTFFFFFFYGDHLNLSGKNVRISDFGRNITLNFGEDIRIFEGLCLKSPITKIFLIRHWFGPPPIKNPGYAYDQHSILTIQYVHSIVKNVQHFFACVAS